MYKTVKPVDIAGKNNFAFEYPTPKQCPVCHTAVDARVLSSHFVTHGQNANVFITYFCNSCEKCFEGVYIGKATPHAHGQLMELLLIPDGFVPRKFSDNIESLSPCFVSIYNQSAEAEAKGLTDICGMGYRKALEFLIKDFIIQITPEHKDAVEKTQLAKCIEEYIDSNDIKVLAKASAWIGNDETHYTRKHPEYNIEHLKAFIDSTVSFIDSKLNFYKAQDLLNK